MVFQCRNTKQAPSPVTHVVCQELVQFGNIPQNRRYAVALTGSTFVSCPTQENRLGYHSFGRQEPQMATAQDIWNMPEAKNQHFCSSTATSAQTKGYAVYHWLLKSICCWNRPERRFWTEQHTQTNMHPAYLGLEGPKQSVTHWEGEQKKSLLSINTEDQITEKLPQNILMKFVRFSRIHKKSFQA